MPAFGAQGTQRPFFFSSQGHFDWLMPLDWLRALSRLQHPLNTRVLRAMAAGTFQQTCTGENQHYWSKRRISNQTSSCKKPQIQPKIWITNLILGSRGSSVPASLAIGHGRVPRRSSILNRVSLACALKCWTAVSHCEKRESSFNFANNASMAASARQERLAGSAVATTPYGCVCTSEHWV